MSRSKLSNTELRYYNTAGGSEVTLAKIKGSTANTLVCEGATAATKVTLANIADPTGTGHAATYDYVNTQINSLSNGLHWKAPARAKTTANLAGSLTGNVFTMTADGPQTLDGIIIALNDRVLFANQTSQTQNGVYTCTTAGDVRAGSEAPAVFTRAIDADSSADLKSCAIFIESGSTAADTAYVQTTDSPVLNTSNIVFAQFSSAGEVLAGTGLTKSGNTINASVDNATIEIASGNISVKGNSIGANQVVSNSLTGNEIQDGSIAASELGIDSVITSKILNSNVTEGKIANLAVTTAKLANDSVTADKIADDACVTASILNANVTTAKIANGAVDSDKLAGSSVISSKLASGAVLTANIGAAQITSNLLLDSNVTTQKLASNSVTSSKIAAVNVLTSHIADNQITTTKVASNQIQASHLKSNAVTSDKILDAAVTADKLAANSVTTSKIGTLSSLTVNGVVSATAFLASGSGSETDGGFSLPKAKSLSIDFSTTQAITGNDTNVTVGSASNLSAVTFTYDDAITMALAFSTFRITHSGTNGTTITPGYEVSYYNAGQVAQAYADQSGALNDFQLNSPSAEDYQLSSDAVLGDGTTRIAGIRMRLKHDVASDTVSIKDSAQLTCIAIDDSSGNINRTYNNGVIS